MFAKIFVHLISLFFLMLSPGGLAKPYDDKAVGLSPDSSVPAQFEMSPHLVVDQAYENSKKAAGRRDNIDERGHYFQGDIVLHDGQEGVLAKSGIIGEQYRWPGGQIPYVIDSTFDPNTEVPIIMQAMGSISSSTCITFVPLADENVVNYIYFRRGASNSGCYADLGMQQNAANNVNLQPGSPGCLFVGIVAHEIIHSIGYYHEQSRTDRDSYVTINWSNIQNGQSHNFVVYDETQVDPYGVSYDYDSIMHYSAYAFAINSATPTMNPTQDVDIKRLGQRNGLSPSDSQKINNMYQGICP